jgi:hypothetical protein
MSRWVWANWTEVYSRHFKFFFFAELDLNWGLFFVFIHSFIHICMHCLGHLSPAPPCFEDELRALSLLRRQSTAWAIPPVPEAYSRGRKSRYKGREHGISMEPSAAGSPLCIVAITVWILSVPKCLCAKGLVLSLWYYWKMVEPLGGGA